MTISCTVYRNDKPIELECWANQYGMDYTADVAVELTDDEMIEIGYRIDEAKAEDWDETKYKTGRDA